MTVAIDCSRPLAEIVARFPASARIFQANRIDFCCRGHQTLEEACRETGRDPAPICEAVHAVVGETGARAAPASALATDALIGWILEKHHAYLRSALPELEPLAAKVARVHGAHDERLGEVHRVVGELRAAIEPHLEQEEQVLFPALLAARPDPAVVRTQLSSMFDDHLEVGRALARLRELTDDFRVPAWGCGSYRWLMSELEALEGDLLAHVHLENHVLMPRFVDAA